MGLSGILKPEYFYQPKVAWQRLLPFRGVSTAEFVKHKLPWGMNIRVRPLEEHGRILATLGVLDILSTVQFSKINITMLKTSFIWWLSSQAYRRKLYFIAYILKLFNFLVFHAILPPEVEMEKDISLEHYGLGTVVHCNVKIGHRVRIFHHVTLAAEVPIGSIHKIFIGDDVIICTGAVIVGRGNQSLTIGNGAIIGANAVVTRDVAPGQTVVGVPARPIKKVVTTIETIE